MAASDLRPGFWMPELDTALRCAEIASEAIRSEFGRRDIVAYKGRHDVQLRADLLAQRQIVSCLASAYPGHGIVAEEGMQGDWTRCPDLWVVDPLDGTNNFGYGVAHCSIAISLFHGERIVLALVHDPILDRSFHATVDDRSWTGAPPSVSLSRASISLITGYGAEGRTAGRCLMDRLSDRCKRVFNLWSPALDLALVATGGIDAALCYAASFLDVCAGMYLVRRGGGSVLDMEGNPMNVRRSLWSGPLSFVAARDEALCVELLDAIGTTAMAR